MEDLVGLTDELYNHTALVFVVTRAVREFANVEICSVIAIQVLQHVEVEFSSHARRIIVGVLNHLGIFLQVDTNHQSAILAGLEVHHTQ